MLLDLELFEGYIRPRFIAYLNGMEIDVLFDTGARSVIFTGSEEYLKEFKLSKLLVQRKIVGFGGEGNLCDVYQGNLVLASVGRIIRYNNVEVVYNQLKRHKGFNMVLPMVLFKDFNISINVDSKRHIRIDTKRNDKITYYPKYNDNGMTVDILYQEEPNPLGLATSLPNII